MLTDRINHPFTRPSPTLSVADQFDYSTGHYRSNIIVFATIKT
jgi:hypothetical protein